jgi:hypothetical protein
VPELLEPEPRAQAADESVAWTRQDPEALALRVRAGAPAILCLSEIWYPGWEARVDGRLADVLRVNGIFRGVRVPAGEHDVALRFKPKSLRFGAGIAIAAALALAVACAVVPRSRDA